MSLPCLRIEQAAECLHHGAVLAYPTEAVWGLGCDPANQAAVLRLLQIKQRPAAKGLILVASTLAQLQPWIDVSTVPAAKLSAITAQWPGPHTWVMPASALVPDWIRGQHASVAVRISAHPVVAALCDAFGAPLVSTSANLAGAEPPRQRDDIAAALLAQIDGVVAGDTGQLAKPTAIRDAITGSTLRG